MPYIKKVHRKPRLHVSVKDGRHLARLHRRRRRRAYAPTSNTASHDQHEKINSWVSFSFLYEYGAPLGGPSKGRQSSAINYCNSTWSSTNVCNLTRIYYLQKRAVRAVMNSDYRAHTAPLFSKLKILDIFQINTLDITKFMFRYNNNLLPPLFPNLFMTNSHLKSIDIT